MNKEAKAGSLDLKNEKNDENMEKINPFPVHPAWRSFIEFCKSLRYGEIAKLKIHDGLPALAEEVRKKTTFIKMRKKALELDGNAVDMENERSREVNAYENSKFNTKDRLYPHLLDIRREKLSENEIINLIIEYLGLDMKTPINLNKIINQLEKMILVEVLFIFNGNQKQAAKALRMNSSTFFAKVKKHNINISRRIFCE